MVGRRRRKEEGSEHTGEGGPTLTLMKGKELLVI